MRRLGEEIRDAYVFDNLSRIHDRRLVAGVGHRRQIVRDQDHRHAKFAAKSLEKIKDLRLYHDVERGGRLVADDDLGVTGESHGDHRALSHPARKFMRVIGRSFAIDLDAFEEFRNARFDGLFREIFVQENRIRDLIPDRHDRI